MKTYLILIVNLLFFATATAQSIYTENFDNLTIGNIGTDYTGTMPGQGGWYTYSLNIGSGAPLTNNHYQIVVETNKGKIAQMGPLSLVGEASRVFFHTGLKNLWQQRTQGNNILKITYDMYTAESVGHITNNITMILYGNEGQLINLDYFPSPKSGVTSALVTFVRGNFNQYVAPGDSSIFRNNTNQNLILTPKTWVRLEVYIDYNTSKAYFYIPVFNRTIVKTFPYTLSLGGTDVEGNPLPDDSPEKISFYMNKVSGSTDAATFAPKFDNINLSVVNTIPTYVLSINEQLATKFNLYPNPATNVVNITNSENMLVNQVVVYDITGKQLSTQTYNNEAEIQLNVENLVTGTYILHLQTNEGTAVKKLIKK